MNMRFFFFLFTLCESANITLTPRQIPTPLPTKVPFPLVRDYWNTLIDTDEV